MTPRNSFSLSPRLPDLSNLTAIAVDDLAFGRAMVQSLLKAAGVGKVEVAATAQEAKSLIRSVRPGLLILDWQLEGETGLDLLHWVRRSPESPNEFLSVLMLTAYREEHRVREAIAAGVTNYLTKPCNARDFLNKVKFCVEDRRSFTRRPDYFGPDLGPTASQSLELD
jgi:two-component system, chemotaxis family, chemotaxis protein CheY